MKSHTNQHAQVSMRPRSHDRERADPDPLRIQLLELASGMQMGKNQNLVCRDVDGCLVSDQLRDQSKVARSRSFEESQRRFSLLCSSEKREPKSLKCENNRTRHRIKTKSKGMDVEKRLPHVLPSRVRARRAFHPHRRAQQSVWSNTHPFSISNTHT